MPAQVGQSKAARYLAAIFPPEGIAVSLPSIPTWKFTGFSSLWLGASPRHRPHQGWNFRSRRAVRDAPFGAQPEAGFSSLTALRLRKRDASMRSAELSAERPSPRSSPAHRRPPRPRCPDGAPRLPTAFLRAPSPRHGRTCSGHSRL